MIAAFDMLRLRALGNYYCSILIIRLLIEVTVEK